MSLPETVFERQYRFYLFVTVLVLVEDRRPELNEYPTKYKNTVTISIFGKKVLSRLWRSRSPGYLFLADKQVEIINSRN